VHSHHLGQASNTRPRPGSATGMKATSPDPPTEGHWRRHVTLIMKHVPVDRRRRDGLGQMIRGIGFADRRGPAADLAPYRSKPYTFSLSAE
jgi:hypothetical protein